MLLQKCDDKLRHLVYLGEQPRVAYHIGNDDGGETADRGRGFAHTSIPSLRYPASDLFSGRASTGLSLL